METDSLRFNFLEANWEKRIEHVGAKDSVDQEGLLINNWILYVLS